MRAMVSAVMLVAIGWLTSGPSAQGLGDIARREAERRQQASAGKKYTNEDLRAMPGEAAPVAAPPTTTAPGSTGSSPAAAPGEAAGAADAGAPADVAKPARADVKTAEQKRGEQFWRDKAVATRSELEKNTARVEGLKKRLQSLEDQLRSGAGSSHAQERDVTLKALEKAEYNAQSVREEWGRLEARAKADKVPAEWLR
jgi:hypothetical protein